MANNNDSTNEEDSLESLDSNKSKSSANSYKKNNLRTKNFPPFMMLLAGLIAFIICYIRETEIHAFLAIVFVSMLVFAIIGTIVKTVVDNFDMHIDYDDLLEEDEGEIHEK